MNIRDIARLAEVSPASVSRVIHGKPGVNPEARERVERILEEHRYRPNLMARGLVQKRSRTIGVALPRVNTFFAPRLDAIMSRARDHGYDVLLTPAGPHLKQDSENLYTLWEKQVEGVLSFSTRLTEEHTAAFTEIGARVPLVVVDRRLEELPFSSLTYDHYRGTMRLLELLERNGHSRVGFIAGSYYDFSSQERTRAYRDFLDSRGLPFRPEWVGSSHYREESGYAEVQRLWNTTTDRPTALLAANDTVAIGALAAFTDLGLSVPDDVSVVGYDDLPGAAYTRPALTTLAQDQEELGRRAVDLLFAHLERPQRPREQVLLEPVLIERASVAPPSSGS